MNTVVTSKAGKTYEYGDRYSDPNRGADQRRRQDGKRKGHQIREMWDSHHEIARRLLLGQKNVDIAKAMNCSKQTVSNVRNSPIVQDKLAVMKAARDVGCIDLAKEIAELAPIAIGQVRDALETGKIHGTAIAGSEVLKQANSILDRQIGKPTQRVDTRNIHGHFTMEDIERIKAKARDLSPIPAGEECLNGG